MMNKKALIAIIVTLVLVVGGAAVWVAVNNVEGGDRQSEQSKTEAEQSEQAVIEEARRYEPTAGTACTAVMTPARHVETGATYTFSSGCIPDGWERTDAAGPDIRQQD